MRTARQIKDLVNNIAKKENINAQVLLRYYMLERLLERISLSKYKENFILKGGMLIASMIGVAQRSTVDIDATIKQLPLNKIQLEKMFDEILNIKIDDGINIKLIKLEEIREEADYKGFRGSFEAYLDKMTVPVKVDLTTGDKITPRAIDYQYNLLIENRNIDIKAYNLETVFAEKFETILTRGITNTRMRDFYDMYSLYKLFAKQLDYNLLNKAISETSKNRNSFSILKDRHLIVSEVLKDQRMISNWKRYQSKYAYAVNISWDEIASVVSEINMKLTK